MDLDEKEYPLFLIDGNKINKISGPVVCYYLVPDESTYETYRSKNIYLPLLLLFGDYHSSTNKMCKPCDQSDACYKIYDKELLKLLDSLSTDKDPVDFYVETFMDEKYEHIRYYPAPYSKEEIIKCKYPLTSLIYGDIEICFKRTKRGTVEYEQKCPTKNIRWHYSDPRENFNFIEGNLYLLVDYMEKTIDNPEYLEKIKFIGQIKNLLLTLSSKNDTKINILKFSEYLLNNPNISKISVINKQIKKQSYFLNKLWSKGLSLLIQDRLQYFIKYTNLNIDKNIYEDDMDILNYSELVKNMDNTEYIANYKNSNEQSFSSFTILLDTITTSLLDIYFITRMLKGQGQQQSSLAVSYFGINHIVYIVNLLKKIFNYNMKFTVGDSQLLHFIQPNRCLSSLSFIGGVQDTIDLTQDVLEHNHKRNRKCSDCVLMFKHKQ